PEEPIVRRGLTAAGLAVPTDLAATGFFRCTDDLEDEQVRALGADAVEEVVAREGETRSLVLLTQMPAQRGWSREALLHRFLATPSETAAGVAQFLTPVVIDMEALVVNTKQAHWHVRGGSFIGVHELLDTVVTDAQDWADTAAERVVALGLPLDSRIAAVAAR